MLPEFNRPRRRSLTRRAWLCLGLVPLTLYLAALTLVPVVSTLLSSLRTPQGNWGLGAYRAITSHYQFGEAVANTLMVTALGLTLELALGLAAALALAGGGRVLGWARVALLVPLGVPTIVAASAMRYVFGHRRLSERGALPAGVDRSAHRLDREPLAGRG